jgi:dolichol-phosphate mannosyltransferase
MKNYLIDEISVFFPCYNEAKNIENTVDKAISVLNDTAKKWEIIIINDGSKDETGKVAQKIQKKYSSNIKIITHNPNRGYGAALKSGLYNSKYELIAFTDSDGQFDFSELTKFIEKKKQTNADIVIGYYLARQVSKAVILSSKIWEAFNVGILSEGG